MRKISSLSHFVMLSAITAAIFMASCIKDEVVDVPFIPTESETIGFGVASDWGEYEDVTRSGVALNRIGKHELKSADGEFTLPMGVYVEDGIHSANADKAETRGAVLSAIGNSFTVWASLANGDASTLYFPAEGEVFENDGTSYKSDPAYFWPGAGTLNFTAVANAPASGFVPNLNAAGTALESFTYTVPQDATAQNDIVLATESVDGANNATVPLNFKHIMSAVNVQVGSISAGTIESITLKGVYNKGTYNVATRKWTVDTTSKDDYSVKFAGGGDSFTTTGNQAAGTPINANDATFMFIPQEPGAGAIMEVVFNNGDGPKATTATIEGDIWDMGKTVNYRISIDESFTLTVEPTGKKLDAHYIMTTVNVTVKNIASWKITATANDNEDVTILPYDEVNILAKEGFWTDKEVDANGVEGSSARGSNSYSGTGDITEKPFVVFIPENISDADRQISIILSSTTEGSTATTTKVLLQKFPNWTNNDIGWEVVDDEEAGKYGFKWTRKVSYIFTYKLGSSWTGAHYTEQEARDLIQGFIDKYDAGDYVTYDTFRHNVLTKRMYIQIDYTKLNNISGATSSSDGLTNTLALYDLAGSAATGAFEAAIKNTYKTESGKEGENMFRLAGDDEISEGVPAHEGSEADLSGILEYILKKNEYQLYKEYNETIGSTTYFVRFNRDDLKWYLPAYGQFTGVDFTPEDTTDTAADYWSSTAVDGNTYSYIGSGEQKDRDESFAVIAGRKNINDYGTASVAATVDNSEMAGGENGEAQWVN